MQERKKKKLALLDKQSRALKVLAVYVGVVLLIFAIFVPLLGSRLNEEEASALGMGEVLTSPVSGDQAPVEEAAPEQEAAKSGANAPKPVLPAAVPKTEPVSKEDKASAPVALATAVDLKKMVWPLKGKVLKPYGMVYSPTYSDYRFHQGIDIQGDMGSEIKAVLPGKILEVTTDQFEGTKIIIDHGEGWQGIYAQLEKSYVQAGDLVKGGQSIGVVGKPGLSEVLESTHLHFGLLKGGQGVNPLDYLPQ